MEIAKNIIETSLKMVQSGLVKGTWGNVSVRKENQLWITPSGVTYEDLTEDQIAVIDLESGVQIGGSRKASSEMPLHRMIYLHNEEINGIVHTHSIYASAFAAIEEEVPCYTEDQAQIIGGSIPVAQYAFPGTDELGKNVVKALEDGRYAVLMAKHGLVAVGRNLKEAWTSAEVAEKSAQLASIVKGMNKAPGGLCEKEIEDMRRIYLESYSKTSIK
ncbi:class II aldolase/adducin family protein [Alkaliphilus hydrothermalis]|uniref:L-fuculose-phosphate aldolase n=1 Tax=Alkaliphilus hydrothermalis TaxID=1482730 RepID=A0ABS2NSL4_9FIRM|nr:class II aldolase/adducin family protein [Alkaliphilus hydrothermalis]MBM7615940.1 L-fuculose-phosphate aldolase [Alkaliphilus hydrothermalis]